MPTKTATPQEISDYLDDMKAGTDAGPVGTPEFRRAVYESQERRKRGTWKPFRCEGCGEWLDEHQIDGLDGRSHARTIRDEVRVWRLIFGDRLVVRPVKPVECSA